MTGVERGIATILQYAADDGHGYVLCSGHHATYDPGTDCAGLARLYAATVEGVGVKGYPDFGTWSERAALTARGWKAIAFAKSKMRRGDVLLRERSDGTGHTVVWLGDGRIVGAEGNWDGRPGDGSGTEVCERSYYDYGYNWVLRPPAWCSQEPEGEEPKVAIDKVDGGVYRLYNASSGQHMYTADHGEAEALATAGWSYEGASYRQGSGAEVYRLYNPYTGGHNWTTSALEVGQSVISGWAYEGVAWRAGTRVELRRLYNQWSGDHVLAAQPEAASLVTSGWTDEGVLCMVD